MKTTDVSDVKEQRRQAIALTRELASLAGDDGGLPEIQGSDAWDLLNSLVRRAHVIVTGRNHEGLTWLEWAAAAGIELPWRLWRMEPAAEFAARTAWATGEDPTEHRAARNG